jgi:hypothetical protein
MVGRKAKDPQKIRWEYIQAIGPAGGTHYLIVELDDLGREHIRKIKPLNELEDYTFYDDFKTAQVPDPTAIK